MSSNQQSSNRQTQSRIEIQVRPEPTRPNRDFIFVLTNNSEILRNTRPFMSENIDEIRRSRVLLANNQTNYGAVPRLTNRLQNEYDREQNLHEILRIDLQEAAREYLSKTHEHFPLHYVFDGTNLDPLQQQRRR